MHGWMICTKWSKNSIKFSTFNREKGIIYEKIVYYALSKVVQMFRINPYQNYANMYDKWFDKNRQVHRSELRAVRSFIPGELCSLEIGVGTGRFAAPLEIRIGIEPAEGMRKIAQQRGINVLEERLNVFRLKIHLLNLS